MINNFYIGFVNNLCQRLRRVPECATPDEIGSIVAEEYNDYCDRCAHFCVAQTFILDSWSERQLGDDFFWSSRRDETLWRTFMRISWRKVRELLASGDRVTKLPREDENKQGGLIEY